MRLKIIAEVGASHAGSLKTASRLVEEAANAGASAIKFQTFSAEQMAIPGYTLKAGAWKGRDLVDLYRETCLPRAWHAKLFALARDYGLEVVGTPFHPDDVKFLFDLGVGSFKVASFEACYPELLTEVGDAMLPIYISTGTASNQDITLIEDILADHIFRLTFLHCISAYPATFERANLPRLRYLRRTGSVGISDHTPGVGVAPLAVALGATVVEKHICNRQRAGQDGGFALTPTEFNEMVRACHQAYAAAQAGGRVTTPDHTKDDLRRGVWCRTPKTKGDPYLESDLVVMRPYSGVSPFTRDEWIGREASEDHGAWERPR